MTFPKARTKPKREELPEDESAPVQRLVMRPLQLHSGNAAERIDDAIHTITHCYSEWEAFSQNEAQIEQDCEAYWEAIDSQVRAVVEGMVFDEPVTGETVSERAEEDAVEASKDWIPFGLKNHDPALLAAIRKAYEEGFRAGRVSA